jgi:hypothetical protein
MRTSTADRRAALSGRLTWVASLLLIVCAGCSKVDQAPASALEGRLDVVDGESISGWVWDRNLPWPPSKVDIYDGETLLATVTANTFRQDVLDAGIGSGQHAFVYATPAELKDGKAHTIQVRVSGSNVQLQGSPKTFNIFPGKEQTASREVSFPVVPMEMNQMTWKDGVGEGQGEDPYLVFALKKPQFVQAIRLRYSYGNAASTPATFQMFWKKSAQNEFAEEERNVTLQLKTRPEEKTLTVVVNDVIDQFRIDPDVRPCVFKIPEITLLVPEPGTEEEQYQQLVRRVCKVVGATVPDGATVLVASGGDDDL